MRVVLAIVAIAAVALGAVALAGTGDGGGDGDSALRRYELRSRFVDRTLPQVAALPPGGGKGRPLLVFLHGRGDDGHEANANGAFLRALAAQGARAPVVVFPNGGEASYWHRRRSGDWARYVLDEVIGDRDPFLRADRVFAGALGIPMRVSPGGHDGGYWQRHYRDYLRFYARALARC